MKIVAVLLCAAVVLATFGAVAGPAHALNGCNPQVSKC